MKIVLLFAFFMILGQQIFANEEYAAVVVKVVDGNTIEVKRTDNEVQLLILAEIDCPDPGQPLADMARKKLTKILLNKDVKVVIHGKNRRGQYLATVTLMKNGADPRIELLEEGLAWTAERNPHPAFEEIRIKAQQNARGLWKDEKPTPPWIYRREQSMMQAKSS